MNPNKCLSRIRTPMPQQPVLDMLRLQRLSQQRIRPQIQHPNTKVVTRPPVSVHLLKFTSRKRLTTLTLVLSQFFRRTAHKSSFESKSTNGKEKPQFVTKRELIGRLSHFA